jgi:hypothetical protein
MNNWITKIWLPFLLLALVVAVYFEFGTGTVKTIVLDSDYSAPTVSESQSVQSSQRARHSSQRSAPKRKSRLAAGERYASLKELVVDQQIAGFVRTGYFGKFWPATVAEIATDKNGISFVRQNGTRHNYTKFYGYSMKMVRLRSGDKETIVVFRSQVKN